MIRYFLIFAITLLSHESILANTWYVNQNATGLNNGSNWSDAFLDLQDAIAASNFGDQIWVAAGVYKPTTTATKTIYFSIKNGTELYGGFNGTEALVSERNPELNLTILSGEIGTGSLNDNTYHVVYFNNAGNQTLFDGFNVTAGYISGSSGGAGMYSTASSPSIINCNFYGNTGYNGGAVYITGAGIINFSDCVFNGNISTNNGGALYAGGANTCNITNCDFLSNQSIDGGAIYIANTLNNIDRCNFSGNQSADLSSCILILGNASTIMHLSNSLLVGNYAGDDHVIYSPPLTSSGAHTIRNCTIANNFQVNVNSTSTVVALNNSSYVSNSIFYDNSGVYQVVGANTSYNCIMQGGGFTGDINILDVNPLFVNSGVTNTAPFLYTSYDYHLTIMSQGIDFGNNTMITGSLDLDNAVRIQNASVDLGAYETNNCNSPVSISGNPLLSICSGAPVNLSVPGGVQFAWSTGSTASSINVNSVGTYSVIVEDTAGCLAHLSVNVTSGSNPLPIIANSAGNLTTSSFNSYQWFFNGDTIPGATSSSYFAGLNYGIYQVNVSSSLGCTGMDDYCFSPASLISDGPTTFCAGDDVNLSVLNGDGFLWSTGSIASSINVTSSGTYSVTVSNLVAGCTVNLQQLITVNPNPTPTVSYSGGLLQTQTYSSYQWYFNGNPISGATFISYIPALGTGQYNVVVTNSNGCQGASNPFNYFVDIKDNDQIAFSFYPNPASSGELLHFNLSPNLTGTILALIIDINGQVVFEQNIVSENAVIELTKLSAGTYILRLESSIGVTNRRLIVL